MTGQDLESRYRRLLAVYPWEHRRVYEDEMLAVLLDGARPGQRRPSTGDVVNVVVAGLRARLRATTQGFAGPAWSDAAAVTGLLATLVLLAVGAGSWLLDNSIPAGTPPHLVEMEVSVLGALAWLPVVGWATVCLAALAGWRWLVAGTAWITVLAEIVLLSIRYDTDPVPVVENLWQAALGLVAALTLTVPSAQRRALTVLRVGRLLWTVLALTVMVGILLVNQLANASAAANDGGEVYVIHLQEMHEIDRLDPAFELSSGSPIVVLLYLGGLAAAGLILLLAVATLAAPVRRRAVVLLAPVAALAAMVDGTMDGWLVSNYHLGVAIHLVPAQWVMLVGVPLATFAAGVLLVGWREQTLRMVAIGRAADRERRTA